MQFTKPRHGKLGALPQSDNTCSFLVWAPKAEKVEAIISEPTARTIPLQSLGDGYFRAAAENVPAGALYKFRLNENLERPDPVSRHQPQGVHGPSQIVSTNHNWTDSGWRGLPLDHYVLYELHVGTFTPQGNLESIIPRLATLKSLGITAIELMPLAQFPGDRNWGYDGAYPFAVQSSYGGPAALKSFVNACHQQKIAVVLDVVYNHLGPEGNYLNDFAPYFTDHYKTPWGQAVNFDGASSDEVRRYFIENALQWIDEFHIDALRLDAIHAIVDASAQTFLEELGVAVHERAHELNRQIFLIPESNRNDPRAIIPAANNGLGLDAVWNDDFHHALHVLLTKEKNGYYQDYSGIEDLAAAYRDGFVYAGQYSKFRHKHYGKSSQQIPAKHFVVFAQNHDQVGNRVLGDRLSHTLNFAQLQLAAATVLLSPYLPLLFMGEEYGEPAPFPYFVSHGDPDLIEAVRKGRRQEFADFAWQGEIPDPQSESTFHSAKLNWDSQKSGEHHTLWIFYQELLRLRRELPALASLEKSNTEVTTDAGKILAVRRWHKANEVLLLANFSATNTEATIPKGRWQMILDSTRPTGAHDKSPKPPDPVEGKSNLQPWSIQLLQSQE